MASEGEFPKTDGDIIYASEVNNFINYSGLNSVLNNMSQLVFNSQYEGFDGRLFGVGSPNFKNFIYDVFQSPTMTSGGQIKYKTGSDFYYYLPEVIDESEYESFDECDGTSIDTNLWESALSAGTASWESGGYIRVFTSGASSNQTASVTSKDIWNNDSYNLIMAETNHKTGDTNLIYPRVKVGGATVYSNPQNVTTSGIKLYAMKIGNNIIYKCDSGGGFGDWTETTDGQLSIEIETDGSWSGGPYFSNVDLVYARYNTLGSSLSAGSSYIISTGSNFGEIINTAIPIINQSKTLNGSIFLSADSGLNWEACKNNQLHRFSNTGSYLKTKVIWNNVGWISEYGVHTNLY